MDVDDRKKQTEAAVVKERDRTTLAVITVLLGAGVWLVGMRYPARVAWPLEQDAERVACVRRGIDPNTAQWFELAQLPGIGEALGKRIIEFRDGPATGSASARGDRVVFRRPADLVRVKGIGEKTVQRAGPFLRFPKQ